MSLRADRKQSATPLASALALALGLGACAGPPPDAPGGGDGGPAAAGNRTAPQTEPGASGTAAGTGAVRWQTRQVQLVAGADGCPDTAEIALAVAGRQVTGDIRVRGARTPLTGRMEDSGLVRLNAAEAAERAIVVDGALDPASGKGQLRVTTYQPACSLRADMRQAPAGGGQ